MLNQFALNIASLGSTGISNQQTVIKETSNLFYEFNVYKTVLVQNIGQVAYFNALLTVFKKQYCQCLTTVAWTGYNSTLQTNVQVVENKLIKYQKLIINQANSTLKTAKDVTTQNFLTRLLTISDYMKITWPNIENCNDMWMRIKFLLFKHLQYVKILGNANLNATYCRIYQATTQSNDTKKLLGNLIDLYRNYSSQLVYSAVKMGRMIGDFNYFGDTHCTCDIEGGTTDTTLLQPSTTSSVTLKSSSSSTTSKTTTSSSRPATTSTTSKKTTSSSPTTKTTTSSVGSTTTSLSSSTTSPATSSLSSTTTGPATSTTISQTTSSSPLTTSTSKSTTSTAGSATTTQATTSSTVGPTTTSTSSPATTSTASKTTSVSPTTTSLS